MFPNDTPLTDHELDELDRFLVSEPLSDDAMPIDMADGLLHAVAIGPTTLHPSAWLARIWGTKAALPPVTDVAVSSRIVGLLMRHFNGILTGLERQPAEIQPLWQKTPFGAKGTLYDDAEGWAIGFVEGMKLCWDDWQPLLSTPDGQAWYRPIGLLGEDDFSPDQDKLTRTPAARAKLALAIPDAVLGMHSHWLPWRLAIAQREAARLMQPKVGRNEACPCGSGKKFKKCCGGAADLH